MQRKGNSEFGFRNSGFGISVSEFRIPKSEVRIPNSLLYASCSSYRISAPPTIAAVSAFRIPVPNVTALNPLCSRPARIEHHSDSTFMIRE